MVASFLADNEDFSSIFISQYHHFCEPFSVRGHKGTVLLLIMKETENNCHNFFFVNA
jgi:hypothetical protein